MDPLLLFSSPLAWLLIGATAVVISGTSHALAARRRRWSGRPAPRPGARRNSTSHRMLLAAPILLCLANLALFVVLLEPNLRAPRIGGPIGLIALATCIGTITLAWLLWLESRSHGGLVGEKRIRANAAQYPATRRR